MTDNIAQSPEPTPQPQRDSDEDTLENRRVQRISHENGFDYDPATSSRQWVDEYAANPRSFWGVALYQNVYGKFWVHRYHQWDRFCVVEPGREAAIKATLRHRPQLVRQIFGRLCEEGEGQPYRSIDPAD